MRRGLSVLMSLVLLFSLCACMFIHASAQESAQSAPVSQENVLAARFLNMLNHNFAYGADFESEELLIDRAILSQLALREGDYIAEESVRSFVRNFYGVSLSAADAYQAGMPRRDGYFYIVPKGYSTVHHTPVSVTANEDGTYLVKTSAVLTQHDAPAQSVTALTLFAPNPRSDLGYYIVYSELLEAAE